MYLSQLPDPKQPHREAITGFCSVVSTHIPWFRTFPPSFFSSRIPLIACVTRDCNGMMCNQGGCQMYFGLRLQKNIVSANIFGASTVSGVAPALKALKFFKRGLWNYVFYEAQACIVVGSPDMGDSPTYLVLYLIFSEVLRFLWPIGHMFMGIFFLVVCCQPTSWRRD